MSLAFFHRNGKQFIPCGILASSTDLASVKQSASKASSNNAREIINRRGQKSSVLEGVKKKIVLGFVSTEISIMN